MRKSHITMVAVFAISGVNVPASAQTADEAAKEEKKICRTEKMTGSLTRRSRICLTQAQWRELNNRTRKGVDELQGSGSGASRCIAGAMDVSCNPDLARGPGGM
jgi:hypothetical protein